MRKYSSAYPEHFMWKNAILRKLHSEESYQLVKGGDPPPLVSPGEDTLEVLGSPVQDGHEAPKASPAEGY